MDNTQLQSKRIGFLGAGMISGVFIERLVQSGVYKPEQILATDPRGERLQELTSRLGIHKSTDNKIGADFGDIIVLAMPSGAVKAVLSESCQGVQEGQIVISLAAAVPTWLIESVLCKPVAVVRVIPNTPSLIGHGMNPYCLGKHVPQKILPALEEFLGIFGANMLIEERLMNAATALTAVGPTYIFPVIDALASAAQSRGIERKDALMMVARTVAGAAQLVSETAREPNELKMMIGTRTLNGETVSSLFMEAFNDAFKRLLHSETKLTH